MEEDQGRVTELLGQISGNNPEAFEELMPLVYAQMRAIAQRQIGGNVSNRTLNATALVHEAYIKMVQQKDASFNDRSHFLAVAAVAMRRLLINYAEKNRAGKRGGGQINATFDEAAMGRSGPVDEEDLLALDEALRRLAAKDERHAKVVEYSFFGGLTHEEIAQVLGVSVPTVRRDWRLARAWLTRELATER